MSILVLLCVAVIAIVSVLSATCAARRSGDSIDRGTVLAALSELNGIRDGLYVVEEVDLAYDVRLDLKKKTYCISTYQNIK